MEGLQQTLSQLLQYLLVSILHRVPCIFLFPYHKPLTHTAPSAAPTNVDVSEVTSSSITVQWGTVPCIHRNGDITGYSVQYGVLGSESTQNMSVSGDNVTISNLAPSTKYVIQVAAMNDAGTGEYSDPVTTNTDGMREIFIG